MGAFDDLIPGSTGGGTFDDLIPQAKRADPRIGQPEELSLLERVASKLPDWMAGTKGAAVGRLLKGASDPAVAAGQILANLTPAGGAVNKWVADQEKGYQDARAIEGSSGFDPLRVAGNFVATAPAAGIGTGIRAGAAVGAGSAALNPVTDTSKGFWGQKGQDVAIGAGTGAVLSPVMGALARLVSPKASTDAGVKMLRDEGVDMSVGQTLGGFANFMEQKATSVPILGDAIAGARRRGIDSFNEAAINRTVAPIGERVKGSGHEAVAEAGDKLSAAYNRAAEKVKFVGFDTPEFNAKFGELTDMAAEGLAPDLAKRFDGILKNTVLRRMSPNGSMDGSDLKRVDSELGKVAAKWGKSPDPAHQEFSDAVKQLKAILQEEVARANPEVAQALKAADKGWAQLVRVEGAAKAAANNEGVFTPAQLMGQVKSGSSRVRGRDVARGEGLMQDLADAGQRLGTKVPDSGTASRMMQGVGAIASGAIHPGIPLALGAGAVAYTPQVQNVLRAMILKRPDMAPAVANYLRQLSTPAALAAGPLMQGDR
jgi:hypothetical protein